MSSKKNRRNQRGKQDESEGASFGSWLGYFTVGATGQDGLHDQAVARSQHTDIPDLLSEDVILQQKEIFRQLETEKSQENTPRRRETRQIGGKDEKYAPSWKNSQLNPQEVTSRLQEWQAGRNDQNHPLYPAASNQQYDKPRLSRILAQDLNKTYDDGMGLKRSTAKYRQGRQGEKTNRRDMNSTLPEPVPVEEKLSPCILEPVPVAAKPPPCVQPVIPKEVASLCECPICFNTFFNPKSLQCEHHFCRDCLGELIRFDENSIPFIRCPTCNSIHMFESKDSTLDSLKCQLVMKQILDSLVGHMEPQEDAGALVQCCIQPVHWYCGDCTQYLCENCIQLHKECRNCTAVRYSRSRELLLPYCTDHEVFQFYGCTTCACSICPFCLEREHKDHMVLSFNEYADKFRGYLTNKVDQTKQYKDQVNKLLLDKTDDVKSVIKKKTNDIVAMIHEVENELLKKAEALQQEKQNRLGEKLYESEEILERADRLSKQGNIGVVWGIPRLLETSPPCTISLQADQSELVDEDDLYGHDNEQALLVLLRNFYRDVEYTNVDELGNVSKRQMDVKSLGLKKK